MAKQSSASRAVKATKAMKAMKQPSKRRYPLSCKKLCTREVHVKKVKTAGKAMNSPAGKAMKPMESGHAQMPRGGAAEVAGAPRAALVRKNERQENPESECESEESRNPHQSEVYASLFTLWRWSSCTFFDS